MRLKKHFLSAVGIATTCALTFTPAISTAATPNQSGIEKTIVSVISEDNANADPTQGWGDDSIEYFKNKAISEISAKHGGQWGGDSEAFNRACKPALARSGGNKARVIQVALSTKKTTSTGTLGLWGLTAGTFAHEYSQANTKDGLIGYSQEDISKVEELAKEQISNSGTKSVSIICVAAGEDQSNGPKKSLPLIAVDNYPTATDLAKFVDAPENYDGVYIVGDLDVYSPGIKEINLRFTVGGEEKLYPLKVEVVDSSDPRLVEITDVPVYHENQPGKNTDQYFWWAKSYLGADGSTGGSTCVTARPGYKFPDGVQTCWGLHSDSSPAKPDETTKPTEPAKPSKADKTVRPDKPAKPKLPATGVSRFTRL